MSQFDSHFHLRPPTAKTVRESRLERMLVECLPYLLGIELEQSSEKIKGLVERIVVETSKGNV